MKGMSIGAKIFSIAIGLIVLMIVVSAVSAVLVDRVRSELSLQALTFLPLSNRITAIETTVLEGEVHIERLRLALSEHTPNLSVEDVQAEVNRIAGLVDEQFARARAILDSAELEELSIDYAVAAAWVHAGLDGVEVEYRDYRSGLTKLLKAHQEGLRVEARLLDELLQEEEIYHQLERMRSDMQGHVQRAVAEIVRLDEILDKLIWLLTGSAVALGLIVSAIVTRRIVMPMRELVSGLKRVEEGDLQTALDVKTSDETASLARGFNDMIAGLRAKERITETFGKYVDPRVVEALIGNPALSKPGGDRRRMTVMFADMSGFTSISEKLSPDALVSLLNAYFEEVSTPIQERDGVIDKFIGDAVMAYFGPPFVDPRNQAELACSAALGQLDRLPAFREAVPETLGVKLDDIRVSMRIGIATGPALVGTVGSTRNHNYTVMGDTVNLAARLEGACKAYKVRALVDEDTRNDVEDIFFREVDSLRVVGKREPVRVFEPIAVGNGTETQARLARTFERGLNEYRALSLDAAELAFKACLEIAPDDGPATVFLERTHMLADNPPAPDWDGVWVMSSK